MIVVYTTIFGGSDSLKPAPKGAHRCVCFTDAAYADPQGWDLVPHAAADPRREAWRLRCLSHDLFPHALRTVWIDASFTLRDLPALLRDAGTAPIAAMRHHLRRTYQAEAREIIAVGQAPREVVEPQIAAYQHAGYRAPHLSISCVIVRDSSHPVQTFNQTWLDEITKHAGDNTQISLDYSAWKAGLEIKALQGTRHANPYAVHDHRDHKKRRQPYATAVIA